MTRDDVCNVLRWADREGWNPGLHDVDPFRAIDADGFFMGWLGERPVGSIAGLRCGDTHGFLGLYIVEPSLRGMGLGMPLWSAGLEHLKGRVLSLDGVVSQQDNYRRSGFELAWCNLRYQGWGRSAAVRDRRVLPLSTLPFQRVADYDRAFHPVARPVFLQAWLHMPQSHALGWWEGGELRGYGVIRACSNGHKIAPLFADTPAMAEALLDALCACVGEGEPVFLDVPESNLSAMHMALGRGMKAVFHTARMVRGQAPQLPLSRLFGLTTLEVG